MEILNAKNLALLAMWLAAFQISHADPLNYWSEAVSGTTNNLNAVIYTNRLFIAVGDAGTILTSPDSVNWATQVSGTTNNLAGVAYGDGKYIAVGANDTVLLSPDATNWTVYANATGLGSSNNLNSVCFGGGKFVATENNFNPYSGVSLVSRIFVSSDGISWAQTYYTISGTLNDVTYGNGLFAFLLNGAVFTSSDTTNWTAESVSYADFLSFANGQFVVDGIDTSDPGNESYFGVSSDGTNWTSSPFGEYFLTGPLCGGQYLSHNIVAIMLNGEFVAGENVGTTNATWIYRNVFPDNTGGIDGSVGINYNGIVYGQNPQGTGVFAAVGGSNIVYSVVYTGPIVWTNTAGGNWSNPTNWNPNEVPGQLDGSDSPDDVQITAPGTYTVVLDEGASPNSWDIRSLTLGAGDGNGAQTLVISNKTFYVNPLTINSGGILDDVGSFEYGSTYHAVINVQNGGQLVSTNGTFYGPITIADGGQMTAAGNYAYTTFHGNVVVNDGGTLTIPAGDVEVANDGSLTIADDGLVNIPNGRLFLYGPMTNSGTVYLTEGNSTTDIEIDNNGMANDLGFLLNLPGGTIVLNGNGGEIDTGAGPDDKFFNQGVILNTSSSHTISVSDFDTSAGVVSNLFGTLTLSTFTNTLAGIFYATNGTKITFTGGTASNPLKPGVPLTLTGGGNFQFVNSWLDLTNDIVPNLQMISGILELEPTFQGGAITNLALDGITLTNAAGITWAVTNGIFAVTNSTVYGGFTVKNGGQLTVAGNGGTATFHGNVTMNAGGSLTMPSGGAEIANNGSLTIDANATVNIFQANLSLYGPMTNSGTVTLTAGPSGASTISIFNNGTASDQGSLLNLAAGTINFKGTQPSQITSQASPDDGDFINQGSIVNNYTGNNSIRVIDFTNSGAIVSQEGMLQLNTVTLQPSGSLNVRLNSKTDYGKISISGAAALTGAFGATLNGIYVPSVGDSFTPLTYGSFTGNFTANNLPPLVAWQTTYNPTVLTLVVTQTGLIPEFTTFASSGGNLIFNGTNGAPGNTYWVLTSTNLTQPLADWTPVATNTFADNGKFSYTNTPDTGKPEQFFILLLPQ